MSNSYTVLAHVYDELNGAADYKQIADAVDSCCDRFLPCRPELVLDLACGTGVLTTELSRRGYNLTGVDASADMLAEAQKNGEGQDILWLNQDMRSFELYGTVGAIVCSFDSLNYLTEDGDLLECFKLAHNYLDPNGIFMFDMNMPNKFRHFYGEHDYILEDDENSVYCGWQNDFDEATGICSFYLTIFEKDKNGLYRRTDEEQEERAYSDAEIRETLQKSGFELLLCSDDCYMNPAASTENSDRLYYVARCKKD